MRQILQSLKNGVTEVATVPCPAVTAGQLLIQTSRTLISAGTERMLVDFSKANLWDKARQQPDKVQMVLNKIKTDGLVATIERVRDQLDQPLPMGYCNCGVVLAVGPGVEGFAIGDRVVSNGKHAEVVSVPATLCARVPAEVTDDSAAFVVIGAIGLQGIRLAQPTLGETVAVMGLGLIGLITVQLLQAQGCRVIGFDFDPARLDQARRFGAEAVNLSNGQDPVGAANEFSRGRGVDAVIITASTKSNDPVHQAAQMCRKRGRIILVGVTGLELSRDDFFKKELTFQVSSSYGPGRYDPNYEEKGQDYPIGFVRWTAQRNFEAVLDMMASGRVDAGPLISHRFGLADAEKAYEVMGGETPSLGILLEYPGGIPGPEARTVALPATSHGPRTATGPVGVSFVGAGNYATAILIPAFKVAGAGFRAIVSNQGVSGLHAGRKFGFAETTTDVSRVFADPLTSTIVISTRHDSHPALACQALAAGKHVFLEKPLAITADGLQAVNQAYQGCVAAGPAPVFMVGFNRRFAAHTRRIKELLGTVSGPKTFVMVINAGVDFLHPLDAGSRSGRGPDRGRRLPFCGPAAASGRRADRPLPCIPHDGRHPRYREPDAGVRRWFVGHDSLPRQRAQGSAEGKAGGLRRRSGVATGQLQEVDRLGLARV